ncbi:hypothetical protein L1049_016087 [Liquidambar formosana]|uniref:UBC core domain-containing protein n=1 Tax=Liquidambar formosana TaxID=63359 RepID=A0AAP0X702_LIQFO
MAQSVTPLLQNGEIENLKRFDVVTDDSDHYYLNLNLPKKNDGDCFTNGGSKVHKKIMQEWKILDQHLPEAILVRVYERRIDLLRAVIVGATGTPYHDGLFFFDIAFPSDYPSSPPQVYYRAFGLRLNPNLYANGRVCLSLLNTWSGKKNEKWNPSGSTILQLLISIQGLVLNEKPYYNEPGLGGWPGRAFLEKNSRAYNEDVFVLSCKTMLFLLRRPPKNFEGFVAEHFGKRGDAILRACKAYTDGRMRVGYHTDDGSSRKLATIKVSTKFKASMEGLYPELVVAFTKNGASLGNFVEQVEVKCETVSLDPSPKGIEKKTVSLEQPPKVIEKKKVGIWKKIIGNLTKILGLKTMPSLKRSASGVVQRNGEGDPVGF